MKKANLEFSYLQASQWWPRSVAFDSASLHLTHGLRPMKKANHGFSYMQA